MRIDRQFLLELVRDYLQSVIENNTKYLRLAAEVKATYNGKAIPLGQNEIWEIAVRFASRQSFVDPRTRSAVFFGTATNEAIMAPGKESPKNKPGVSGNMSVAEFNRSTTHWWYYAVRLTVDMEGKLCEVEEITTPEKTVHFEVRAEDYPCRNRDFDTIIPLSRQHSREELIQIADTYWRGIDKSMPADEVPIHPDCNRIELGTVCTNARRNYFSQNANFRLPGFSWKIENPRYYIVDIETGTVVCMAHFVQYIPDTTPSFVAAEAFKIEDGLIRSIMAFFKPMSPVCDWKDALVPCAGEEEK